MYTLKINGIERTFDVEADMPLLWLLRDEADLTGSKFGCGMGLCGACSVIVDGSLIRSCVMSVSSVAGSDVRTVEGIARDGRLSAIQQAWLELDVPQCGYCQSGMIMAVTALLETTPKPSASDVEEAISNICRCGTYDRIRAAIDRAAQILAAS